MKKILYTLIIGLEMFMLSVGPAAAEFDTVRVKATVGEPTDTVMISVSPGLVNFASITASLSQYRFREPLETEDMVEVTWDAIVDYEIRVYTDNGVGAIPGGNDTDLENPKRLGFIRSGTAADADRLPLKIWCPNFSGTDAMDANKGPRLADIGAKTQYLWKGADFNKDGDDIDDVFGKNPLYPPIETNLLFDEDNLNNVLGIAGNNFPPMDLNGDGDTDDVIAVNHSSPPPEANVIADNLGESASFAFIREWDTMADSATDFVTAPKTRTLLAWNQPGLNAERKTPEGADLGKPSFPVCFAVDLTQIPTGNYDSNNNGDNPVDPDEDATDGIIFEIMPY